MSDNGGASPCMIKVIGVGTISKRIRSISMMSYFVNLSIDLLQHVNELLYRFLKLYTDMCGY